MTTSVQTATVPAIATRPPAAPPRFAWARRINLRLAIFTLVAGFIVIYPAYQYIATLATGGISRRGDVIVVNLMSMSSFEMDQTNGTTADVPARYRALDGKRVELAGEMWSPHSSGGEVDSFVLVYSINNCCVGPSPKAQHLIMATVPAGGRVSCLDKFVKVTGILHVGVERNEAGGIHSVFRIDAERVEQF